MLAVVLALAGVTLTASPDAGQDKYQPEVALAAEQRLAQAGEVLGAAWMCRGIDRTRLRAAMRKVEAMIDKGVDDNQQYYAARHILDKGIDKGKSAIGKHETDCRRADAALGDLEKQLGP
ncbi:MAG TPA: hypothetical protein VEI03_03310 [Stellaceae bacterium]|nr:hypothetical protein [Stellaceae bacterium]